MPCRVGITTNPGRRKREWQEKHPTLTGWTIIARYKTKSEAQAREIREAQQRGCNYGPGGSGNEHDDWSVYYFRY